ncbi:5054_t:CDS:2 [Ambispora gerdemannii]|uniref:5054_t:CDS:1 n=1 Tax=Ambispora gerdemannii TaxID=144530 RepID=A0A9N8ZDF5_9GLOM|nr:5054_t:CDS:2 [Ambispora gerdemannii]
MSSEKIFAIICEHLSPYDLLSLTRVCRRFKEFLCSPTSSATQQIWRLARVRYLRSLQLPPPETLDEKQYYVLSLVEKGCQFCGRAAAKIRWAFRVRACDACVDERTLRKFDFYTITTLVPWVCVIIRSHDKLFIEWNIPSDVLSSVLYSYSGPSRIYWMKDVTKALKEYNSLKDSDEEVVKSWIETKRAFVNRVIQDVQHREYTQQAIFDVLGARLDRLQIMLNGVYGHVMRSRSRQDRNPQRIPTSIRVLMRRRS